MTIAEIKKQITDAFMANETIKERYDLQPGKSFEEQFSTVSLENIFFFCVATAISLVYKVFDQFKIDILSILKNNKAHTPNWYATRAKEFQFGHELISESDQYDNSALTTEQIEAARVVKFAAAIEASDQSILYLKVATDNGGIKQPIKSAELVALTAYMGRVKDAGVRISIINSPADDLRLEMDIYYNPLILDSEGKRLDGSGDTPVQDAIRNYISNLAFNGFYYNQSLVDKLQVVDGVEIAELIQASSRYGTLVNFRPINARSIPYAGYYQIADKDLILNFIPNE
ncbi:hypothetical protein [Dysgonomonas sp. Marseille-P4361]|uniref:hypothetical protein n=1 Tax=Dysgonomonas sp. Marseille-P4361 TaxID=2161820 RepID=UPI000D54DBBB|nr:hypothetical protein [Dysgonomonas sp. Marseille-P4361]